MIRNLDQLSEISSDYDLLLIDIWGTIHDGEKLFANISSCFFNLKRQNKKIFLFSNSPRMERDLAEQLSLLGLESHLYDGIISAGELFSFAISEHEKQDSLFKNYNPLTNLKKNFSYFHIGVSDLFLSDQGLTSRKANDIESADVVLLSKLGPDFDYENASNFAQNLMRHNKPLICLNPDLHIVTGEDKKIFYCEGLVAKFYEEAGGSVIYFGKPYNSIYYYAMIKSGIMNADILIANNKPNILAIGDSITTDVKGAANFGVDSCLVMSGISQSNSSTEAQLSQYLSNNSNIMTIKELIY